MSAPSRPARGRGSSFFMELRSAWRTLRARGLVTGLHVTLVALAVGTSGIVFAAADAFALRPAPYPNADRLMVFQRDVTGWRD